VKTAISIPDETFARAERQAAVLGVSRSEFFTRAVRRYLEQLDAESLTDRINVAVDLAWPAAGSRQEGSVEDDEAGQSWHGVARTAGGDRW
jgi:hypothetical protein